MADLSITIANATTPLGMSPPVIWNAFTWNASLWGYSGDLPIDVIKGIASTTTPDTTLGFSVIHALSESVTSDSAVGFDVIKGLAESVTFDSAPISETLTDPAGYTHVFPSNATNAEDRDIPTWTSGTVAGASWSTATVTTTTWS